MSEPRKGIHRWRLPGVDLAAVDVLGTIAFAFLLARGKISKALWYLLFLVILGEMLHIAFGVPTPVALWITDGKMCPMRT